MRRRPLVPRLIAPTNCSEKGMMSNPAGLKPSSPLLICRDGNANGEGQESVPSPGNNSTSDEEWHPSTDRPHAGDSNPIRRETRKHNNHLHRCPLLGCNGNENDAGEKQEQEEEETRNDDHFYCEECQSFYLEECETHGPPSFTHDSPTPLGVPQRALLTLPPGLMVGRSRIPGAGLGVFNQGQLVPVGMHFGPFEGEVTSREKAIESSYSWAICRKKNQYEYVDGTRDSHSNWMRYVNCARNEEEQNLVAFQHRGRVLYRCLRPIPPGQELLVWCADEYSKELGVTWYSLWIKKCTAAVLEKPSQVLLCTQCEFPSGAERRLQRHSEQARPQADGDPERTEAGAGALVPRVQGELRFAVRAEEARARDARGRRAARLLRVRAELRPARRPEEAQAAALPGEALRLRPVRQDLLLVHRPPAARAKPRRRQVLPLHRVREVLRPVRGSEEAPEDSHGGEAVPLHRLREELQSAEQPPAAPAHPHGEKPYGCTECGKRFSYSEQLKVHLRTHTGEKPFLCTECGESFRQSGDLKRHERKHTGVRPCRCDECGKSFSRPNSLKAHQLLHKGERPYRCPQCDKCFIRTGHLRRHVKKMHS
ncbi:hypothetical protein ANANG_G00043210 [Anguilla anguilla]|uniref:Histone-lysine N-methyltransferase PRDM9-like n=1 Tax=Anguilla anguilla TaxID=7936 RepID=A0A9D3MU58_ANGAN|nr:hypothetical protein ANANG_G00043210 [Anguilla anguilla]